MWEEGVCIYGTPGISNNFPSIIRIKLVTFVSHLLRRDYIWLVSYGLRFGGIVIYYCTVQLIIRYKKEVKKIKG